MTMPPPPRRNGGPPLDQEDAGAAWRSFCRRRAQPPGLTCREYTLEILARGPYP